MDELDPAREIIVEAITTLEDAIEDLMTGQAPRSSKADIAEASASLRKLGEALCGYAERIDNTLNPTDRRGS
jgi:hypothetical protein